VKIKNSEQFQCEFVAFCSVQKRKMQTTRSVDILLCEKFSQKIVLNNDFITALDYTLMKKTKTS
jgi:hypothetical protein